MTRSTLLTIRRMTNTGQRDLKIILLPRDLERPDGWRKTKLPCVLPTLRSKIFNSRWVWRYFHLTPPLPFTTVLGLKVLICLCHFRIFMSKTVIWKLVLRPWRQKLRQENCTKISRRGLKEAGEKKETKM